MDTSALIITIVSQVLSFGSALTMFVLGLRQHIFFTQLDAWRERVKNLYAPFYQKCILSLELKHTPSKLSFKASSNLLDLLSNNIMYMGIESQKEFQRFYNAFILFYLPENDEINEKYKRQYNVCFKDLGKALLSEYTYLCKKLKLEPPIELF